MRHEPDAPEAELVHERPQVVAEQADGVRTGRDLAPPRSAQVVGDDAEIGGQAGDLVLPDVRARPAEAVHEHDRRAGAGLLDVRRVAVQLELQCWTSAAVGIDGTADFAFWMCSMSIR